MDDSLPFVDSRYPKSCNRKCCLDTLMASRSIKLSRNRILTVDMQIIIPTIFDTSSSTLKCSG